MPYFLPACELISKRPSLRLIPSAATPKSGMPTPVIKNPRIACQICAPAACPINTGKIRFPAPKNRPNSMLPTTIVSEKRNCFFIILSRFPSMNFRALAWCRECIYYSRVSLQRQFRFCISVKSSLPVFSLRMPFHKNACTTVPGWRRFASALRLGLPLCNLLAQTFQFVEGIRIHTPAPAGVVQAIDRLHLLRQQEEVENL